MFTSNAKIKKPSVHFFYDTKTGFLYFKTENKQRGAVYSPQQVSIAFNLLYDFFFSNVDIKYIQN